VPTTVAKVSGLRAPGAPYTAEAVRPAWDAALELFGPERLMFASDWPVTVPEDGHGPEGYRPTYEVLAALVGELSAAEQHSVMGGTATRIYRLG
jgi:L-fuconolactonase